MILNDPRIKFGLRLAWGAALLGLVALFTYDRAQHSPSRGDVGSACDHHCVRMDR